MANGTKKQTVAILMLMIAVIGLTATALAKFYSLKSRVEVLEKRCPDGYKHLPIGSIVAYHKPGEPPKGWLLCDGKDVPKGKNYETLRGIVKENKTPDLQGMFLRGAGQNENSNYQYAGDKDRLVGSPQGHATALPNNNFSANLKHAHGHGRATDSGPRGGGTEQGRNGDGTGTTDFKLSETQNTSEDGGDEETRPNNYAVNFIIKAF